MISVVPRPDLSGSTIQPAPRQRIQQVTATLATVNRFFVDSVWAQQADTSHASDFVLGNPHEPPLPEFVAALHNALEPQNNTWYAYKRNEPASQAVIAESLRRRRGQPFVAEDIFLTNGAFAGISVTLKVVCDPGDEVIFISPPWFFYEALIRDAGATPVRVPIDPVTFDLDLAAITAAISPRTRAIIINSPNNPTGKIYPAATLTELARLLAEASARSGRRIYLLSDEAYSRIVFDNHIFPSPAAFYPHAFVIYTYAKTLLTPGQRIGYIALSPDMPEREQLRSALLIAQYTTGFAFPNALLQHALPEFEELSIDIAHLQRKRDKMVTALRALGYTLNVPEGTFYLLVRAPLADDFAFVEQLAAHQVYCLPGHVVEMPGYFRISLTANDAMIERSLPGFAAAWQGAQ
jgi:aspartate aminotransferase